MGLANASMQLVMGMPGLKLFAPSSWKKPEMLEGSTAPWYTPKLIVMATKNKV